MTLTSDSPIQVLLIEDCDIDAMFVERILCSNPASAIDVQLATTLGQAMTKLQRGEYDVALLDLSLPDSTGLASYDQLRALDARLPIVVLTGLDDEEVAQRAIESGAQDVIAKGHVNGQILFRSLRFAIARQKKMLGIQAEASSDPLTGMPNRRNLQVQYDEMVARARQDNSTMSFAMIDLDHFKRVNDLHGHFVGDAVLKELARILSEHLPPRILASRYGGEEFTLMMPDVTIDQACQYIQSVLDYLASNSMKFDDIEITVTASAGVKEIDTEESWDSAFKQVDQALYEAKASGRNRLCRVASKHSDTLAAGCP